MTGDIINLNKARKARDKAAKETQAAHNRVGFGRTKGQKAQTMTMAQKLKKALDDAKRNHEGS